MREAVRGSSEGKQCEGKPQYGANVSCQHSVLQRKKDKNAPNHQHLPNDLDLGFDDEGVLHREALEDL